MITGVTFSSFDLLHAGHIQMLREAKSQCDYLICGLQTDPSLDRPEKNQPAQSLVERYIQLSNVKWVDEVIPYQSESEVIDILELYVPDVRIIGDDYRDKDFTGKQRCIELDIDIYYNSRNHRFSTKNLRRSIKIINTTL